MSKRKPKLAAGVKSARDKAGLTQAELASRCRAEQSTISKIESGIVRSPGVSLVAKIATACGVTVEELIGG